ncbi:oligosaccharide flippase family protein [Microbacterium sp. NPDC077184]|uniref:lipopolysaccharide biosynthesis protein n=1 Tax=Microbacterium sp. NPDC077184 TaxID=3154764 RepID=UPI003443B8FF
MINSIVSLSAARLIASLMQAAAFVSLARQVPVSEFGITNTLLAIGALAMVVADLGLGTFLLRAHSLKDPRTRGALLLNAHSTLTVGLAGTGIVYVLSRSGDSALAALSLLPIAIAMEKNFDTSSSVAIADGRTRLVGAGIVLRRALTLSAVLAAMTIGFNPLLSFCGGYLAGSIAAQLVLRFSRVIPESSLRPQWRLEYEALRASGSYLASNVSAQARQLDIPIAQLTVGGYGAGLYAGASRLVTPFSMIAVSAANVILPRLTKAKEVRARRLAVQMGFALAVMVVASVPASLLAPWVVVILFGDSYADAGAAAILLVLALPFVSMATPMGAALQAIGLERAVAVNGMSFAAVFVAAAILMSLTWGIAGVAAATLVAYIGKCVALLAMMKKRGGSA